MAKLSGQASDMNVQAAELQILPLRITGGKLRRQFNWAVRSSGAFLSVADEACSTHRASFSQTPDAWPPYVPSWYVRQRGVGRPELPGLNRHLEMHPPQLLWAD